MLRRQGDTPAALCCLGNASASGEALGGRPRDPARMFEGRRLCGIEAAGGCAGKEVGRRIDPRRRSRIDMKPKPHVTKWTLMLAIKVRRFDTKAEADAEGD
jgi:hypothetical protein